MEIKRVGSQPSNQGPADWFTGTVRIELRKEHTYRTGQAMTTVYQPLEHYTFDYDKLSRNIGTCVGGGEKFSLNSDALALVWGTYQKGRSL